MSNLCIQETKETLRRRSSATTHGHSHQRRSSMARLFKGYGDTKFTSKWRGKRAIVFTITAISLIDLVFHASRWVEPSAPIAWLTSGPAFFQRDTSSTNETNWKICQECNINDSIPGRYINSIHFGTPVPTLDRLQKGKVTKAEVAKYLLNNVILESNLNPVFLPDTARATLFSSYLSDPDSLLSFSFSSLRPLLPTMYLFTRTGSTGRLSGPGKRLRYMNRHISMLKDYQELVRTEGYGDGANIEMGERQLLWIVVEDEPHLETGLNTLLQQSKIPFIYIAHGPTKYVLTVYCRGDMLTVSLQSVGQGAMEYGTKNDRRLAAQHVRVSYLLHSYDHLEC